jgi:hypothetical protein
VRRWMTGSVAALLLVVAASCGSEPPRPRPIPAGALPGSAGEAVVLDVQTVATDAIAVEELEGLLLDAGFSGGSERLFSKAIGGRRHMLARVLEFESPQGAQRYVGWLQDHVDELIGDAHPAADLEAPADGTVFVHEPDPCCHNETRIFLVVWTTGERVVTLEIGGQAARAAAVSELALRLDAAV